MEFEADDLCVCGHTRFYHSDDELKWCWNKCFRQLLSNTNWQHTFQLDNLALIEKLAKERGLI